MKITIINQFCPPDLSPTARLIASLAQHRVERGDQVTVVGGQGYTASLQDASENKKPTGVSACDRQYGLHIKRVWTPRLGKKTVLHRCIDYLVFYMLACITLIRLPRQEVIICLTTPPLIALAGLLHKFFHRNTRIILWNMDCYPEILERTNSIHPNGIIFRSIAGLNRFVSARLDHVVCLDSAMRDLLRSRNDSKQAPISIIPNWEQLDRFSCPEATEGKAHSREKAFTVLYSGNMGHGHCFKTVLDAAKIMNDTAPNIQFLITGGGVQEKFIRQTIRSEQLDNVVFEGYVSSERLRIIQQNSHCALITLKNNMLGCMSPSKLHANLAMGLPIIYLGPAGSNIDDALKAYQCGVSLRQGNTQDFIAALQMLKSSSKIWKGFAKRSRYAFEDHYCDKKKLPLLDAIIDSTSRQSSKHSAIKNAA